MTHYFGRVHFSKPFSKSKQCSDFGGWISERWPFRVQNVIVQIRGGWVDQPKFWHCTWFRKWTLPIVKIPRIVCCDIT